ncbi:MAG: shikimate dehydrogenase [Rhodospirillales bacterium]|jgi:shikimate dehydrogenase|nr:shikimate dehydrogenase [Rhodospirillales bacterium]
MTRRAFVIGHPIAHSRSPMLHGYWLRRYRIDATYERRDVSPSQLADFVAEFRREGWAGCNVTVPHKTAIVPHLDRLDETAVAVGAVNTLWWEAGELVGGNTDASGFLANLDERVPGWDRRAGHAVLLGAGGAARAAIVGLRQRGFSVAIFNRSRDTAAALAAHFGEGVAARDLPELAAALAGADLLINATSLGMSGQPALVLDLASLPDHAIVHDVVYAPLETALLRAAAARGLRTVDGLGMLLHQATPGFRRWFATEPEVTAELRALLVADIRSKTPD